MTVDPAAASADASTRLGTDRLRFERRGPIGWCVVDNAGRRNSLSPAMYRGLGRAIGCVVDDLGLRALVITGVEDVFIVGGDMGADDDAGDDEDELDAVDLPFDRMQRGEVPVVAAVNGHCQASGVLLAILSDVAIASDRARFRLPELRRGVAAPWSATLLPSVVGLARAKDLALTSRSIDAHEALDLGLVSRVVSHADLHGEAERVALELLEAGPTAAATWKATAHARVGALDHAAVEASYATEEAAEGFAAFLERRPPRWSPAAHDR